MSRILRAPAVVSAVCAALMVTACGNSEDQPGAGAAAPTASAPATSVNDPSANDRADASPVATSEADWQKVADALGRAGKLSADGLVYRVGLPRSDLNVTSYDVAIKPGFALGSYAAFTRYPDGTVVMMGDLVVTEKELATVTDALQRGGVDQTAVHKHLLAHQPHLWWSHIHAAGTDAPAMAKTVRAALDRTGSPTAKPAPTAPAVKLDTTAIDTALGAQGTNDGGTYKFSFKRSVTVTGEHGVLPPGLGLTTAINFQPTGDGRAAVNGDFAMTAKEVQPVIKALRGGGIDMVEVHHHSLDEQPRLFYMHFWAEDDAVKLAKALGEAVRAHDVTPAG